MFWLVMQEKWQDEDDGYDLLYHAILCSTAAAIYHWPTQDGDWKQNSKQGFSNAICHRYCHFLKLIATAMVLSWEPATYTDWALFSESWVML